MPTKKSKRPPARGRVAGTRMPDYIPGQVVLRIRGAAVQPALGLASVRFAATTADRTPDAVSEPLDYLRRNAGLKEVRPLFSSRQTALTRASVRGAVRAKLAVMTSVADSVSEELSGVTLLHLDPKKVNASLIKRLSGSRAVEFVERMPARWLLAKAKTVDPMQNVQWGLRAIRWFQAKKKSAKDVTVAVLDTGIDRHHPDFKGVPIIYHHDGLKAEDILGHGTHVSGIIGAATNNGVGISGVADCRVSMWKIFPDKPNWQGQYFVDSERYLQALNGLLSDGARVVNLSIGGGASSQVEQLLFRRLERNGVVVVAAMGNEFDEGNPIEYPAAYDGVMAVGAIDETMKRAWFSNTGKHINICAPGVNILSTLPMKKSVERDENEYASWNGTSMATPHVAGAAALVVAKKPSLTAAQVKSRLKKTTHLKAMRKKSWTAEYGSGLLNLEKALK